MMPESLKHHVYEIVLRPALLYGAETWALRFQKTDRLRTTEVKMLRWLHVKTRKNHVRNANVIERANLVLMEGALRTQRLKWCTNVLRQDKGHTTRAAFDLEIVGAPKRTATETLHGGHRRRHEETRAAPGDCTRT